MNTPPAKEGGVAAFKVEDVGGKTELTPAWVSFATCTAKARPCRQQPWCSVTEAAMSTKQAWPDIGLTFDSSVRAAKAKIATIYVLDAQTGRELWNSGSTMGAVQPLLRHHRRQRPCLSVGLRRSRLLLRTVNEPERRQGHVNVSGAQSAARVTARSSTSTRSLTRSRRNVGVPNSEPRSTIACRDSGNGDTPNSMPRASVSPIPGRGSAAVVLPPQIPIHGKSLRFHT